MANVTQFNRTNAGEAILLDVQGFEKRKQGITVLTGNHGGGAKVPG